MKRVCVIGHFAFGKELLNGQTIKTKTITEELQKQLGKENVWMIDTHGGKKKFLQLIMQTRSIAKKCKNIIMLPTHNGVRFLTPLLCIWGKIYHIKIHYIVIGGWLPEYLQNKKGLQRDLKKFNGIYVETNIMKKNLEKMGFNNIYIMPNCKNLQILREDELIYTSEEPLKLCTFSRVMREKGIEEIIKAVTEINQKHSRDIFHLDIYGQIDEEYQNDFERLKKTFPNYIRYCGSVPYNKSTDTLKKYYALVFPTNFYTEGIPGTIIDAYASGIPVISSKWENFTDLIEDGKVGYGYQFGNYNDLINLLLHIANNPNELNSMKVNCIKKAKEFSSEKVIANFLKG